MDSKKGVVHLSDSTTKVTKRPSIFRGLILAMLSGVCFSIVVMIVKHLKNLHPGQLALFRFIATCTMNIPETYKTGQNPLGPRKLRYLLVIRGISGGLNQYCNFIAFRYLDLAEANTIIFSSPVFIIIFARIFFKEPCNVFQAIAVIFTVIGIIFTTKLPSRFTGIPIIYSHEKICGVITAVLSIFFVSATILITRKVKSVPQSIITFNYSWVGFLVIAFLTSIFGNFRWHHCGIQSILILLLGLFSYCSLSLVVMALQCEYAGPVIIVRAASDIGLAFLWQILIFNEVPDLYTIIGATSVLVSIILVSLESHDVHFQWIPSHVNIYSNERVDSLAKEGCSHSSSSSSALSFLEHQCIVNAGFQGSGISLLAQSRALCLLSIVTDPPERQYPDWQATTLRIFRF
ncbi:solute carrier family 35 member G1-like [Argiope bruennichi]|uniref:solute carrier family 35 member G1-like n=1 Tax=Argiope bruennichi TaxID=94029 RepID=UPI0024954FAD|nr:solute carrier family 35 member G1-like [Argiope bruennichi]